MLTNQSVEKRPFLKASTDPEVFKKFYWDKKELIAFCSANNLSPKGGKLDLATRIEVFLRTGKTEDPEKQVRTGKWDSESKITRETPVINYKNDARTKAFFEGAVGQEFHFNSYLRQFAKSTNKDKNLTYGDLVEGWLKEEAKKKDPKYKSTIGKQFQYNQFQRDFYAAEKGKSRKEFMEAWRLVRSVPGAATYEHYVALTRKKASTSGERGNSSKDRENKKKADVVITILPAAASTRSSSSGSVVLASKARTPAKRKVEQDSYEISIDECSNDSSSDESSNSTEDNHQEKQQSKRLFSFEAFKKKDSINQSWNEKHQTGNTKDDGSLLIGASKAVIQPH